VVDVDAELPLRAIVVLVAAKLALAILKVAILFHSWAVSRLKAAISLQNLALSITKRWRSILLIIKYINNVFIS